MNVNATQLYTIAIFFYMKFVQCQNDKPIAQSHVSNHIFKCIYILNPPPTGMRKTVIFCFGKYKKSPFGVFVPWLQKRLASK